MPEHILKELRFPARHEALSRAVGDGVANLLVPPAPATQNAFQQVATSIGSREEGAFIPVFAPPGTGKTTLAHGLGKFLPSDFASTIAYLGETVTYEGLVEAFDLAESSTPANETRARPLLIDHREGNLPTRAEFAAIKRFLRTEARGVKAAIIWPETDNASAQEIGRSYERQVGASSIPLPVTVEGPPRATWVGIAENVLRVVNQIDDLASLGVDPGLQDPATFNTIGDFMRRLSDDFDAVRLEILRSTLRPLRLVILFASGSSDAGQLTHLTNSSRYGLLDAAALIDATRDSDEGRFWHPRRGDLVHTILQLDAHAFSLPPQVSMTALRMFAGEPTKDVLVGAGMVSTSRDHARKAFRRSDLGKFLAGSGGSTTEQRGTPATVSEQGFSALSAVGFTGGRDKVHNKDLLTAWQTIIPGEGVAATAFFAEAGLGFVSLIPDNRFDIDDVTYCLEYTWRTGDFLSTRSKAARYILAKLKQYAIALGTTSP